MKNKIILCLMAMALFVSPAFAINCANPTDVCPKPPYPISRGLPLFLSNVSGTNFVLTKIGESVLEKELKKELGAKFDVQIYAYGGKDLIEGKFKKIKTKADNVAINGLSITSVRAESVCEYNHFIRNGNDVYAGENFLSKFEVVVSSNDLQRTLASSQYVKMLNSMNLSFNSFVLFKVFDPVATIKNNRINLSLKIVSPLVHAGNVRNVSMNMGLCVDNGQIKFSDIQLGQNAGNINLNAILPIVNKLNPFMYEMDILKTKGSVVKISDIKIVNDNITINGTVFIPKRNY